MTINYLNEVFTPTSPAHLTFVERPSINDRLVDDLMMPGKQMIIYGHTGSGKTTLLVNKLRQVYEDHICSQCVSTTTFEQLMAHAIGELGAFYDSEYIENETAKYSGSIAVSGKVVEGKVGIDLSKTDVKKKSRIGGINVTPQLVGKLLGKKKCCWVIEDFHKLRDKEKVKLAQVMKLFMDMSFEYPSLKIIVVGAVNTAREVINYDAEMNNRVAEIEVPLMGSQEIREIIRLGEKHLNIRIEPRVKDGFILLSNGLAAACHQLCYCFCSANQIRKTQETNTYLDLEKYRVAIQRYMSDSSDTIKQTIDKALKQPRNSKFNHPKLIFEALLQFDHHGATRGDILDRILAKVPEYNRKGLTNKLRALLHENRGAILRFDLTSEKYSFSKPILRSYIHVSFEADNKKPNKIHEDIDLNDMDVLRKVLKHAIMNFQSQDESPEGTKGGL